MSKPDLPIFNTNDAEQFARLLCHVASLRGTGLKRVSIENVRNQRTLSQNAFYWSVIAPYAAKGLRDAWGEDIDSIGAHDFLKAKFLRVPVSNKRTGELMGYRVRSTTDLDTAEFAAYIDKIVLFCAEQLGVAVPAADRFHGTEAA
jgi:hypothetical protein